MKPERLRALRREMIWTCAQVAAWCECSSSLASAWERGTKAIPPHVAEKVEARAALLRGLAPPRGWKRHGGRGRRA